MKRAALSYYALQPNSPAHESGQAGTYGKSQARAAIVAGGAAVGLGKRLKYQGVLFGRNADARVRDAEMQVQFMMAE
jgi:hypothetical protein